MAINKEYETTVNLIGDSQGITISSATVSHVQVAAVSFLAGPKGNQGDPATNLVTSVNDKQGSVTVTKTDTGLGNVDNTSDLDKPVSTATQTALNGKRSVETGNDIVYINNASGTQGKLGYSYAAVADTLAVRGLNGVVRTGTPSGVNDATPKTYVDIADALKVNKAGDTMTGQLKVDLSADPSNGGIRVEQFGNGASHGIRVANAGLTSGANMYWNDNTNFFIRSDAALNIGGASNRTTINGIDHVTGTGFPNGVVSAPVGSIYIDTNITNGASSWIKKSGTGNTGWQVLEGDTGWRDIRTSLHVNWKQGSSTWAVRRVGNVVFYRYSLRFDATNGSAGNRNDGYQVGTVPTGFVATFWSQQFQAALSVVGGLVPSMYGSIYNFSGQNVMGVVMPGSATARADDDRVYTLYSIITDEAYPTTLPGTAV